MSTARRTTGESVQPHIGSEQGRRQHPAVIRAAFENDPCGARRRARGLRAGGGWKSRNKSPLFRRLIVTGRRMSCRCRASTPHDCGDALANA